MRRLVLAMILVAASWASATTGRSTMMAGICEALEQAPLQPSTIANIDDGDVTFPFKNEFIFTINSKPMKFNSYAIFYKNSILTQTALASMTAEELVPLLLVISDRIDQGQREGSPTITGFESGKFGSHQSSSYLFGYQYFWLQDRLKELANTMPVGPFQLMLEYVMEKNPKGKPLLSLFNSAINTGVSSNFKTFEAASIPYTFSIEDANVLLDNRDIIPGAIRITGMPTLGDIQKFFIQRQGQRERHLVVSESNQVFLVLGTHKFMDSPIGLDFKNLLVDLRTHAHDWGPSVPDLNEFKKAGLTQHRSKPEFFIQSPSGIFAFTSTLHDDVTDLFDMENDIYKMECKVDYVDRDGKKIEQTFLQYAPTHLKSVGEFVAQAIHQGIGRIVINFKNGDRIQYSSYEHLETQRSSGKTLDRLHESFEEKPFQSEWEQFRLEAFAKRERDTANRRKAEEIASRIILKNRDNSLFSLGWKRVLKPDPSLIAYRHQTTQALILLPRGLEGGQLSTSEQRALANAIVDARSYVHSSAVASTRTHSEVIDQLIRDVRTTTAYLDQDLLALGYTIRRVNGFIEATSSQTQALIVLPESPSLTDPKNRWSDAEVERLAKALNQGVAFIPSKWKTRYRQAVMERPAVTSKPVSNTTVYQLANQAEAKHGIRATYTSDVVVGGGAQAFGANRIWLAPGFENYTSATQVGMFTHEITHNTGVRNLERVNEPKNKPEANAIAMAARLISFKMSGEAPEKFGYKDIPEIYQAAFRADEVEARIREAAKLRHLGKPTFSTINAAKKFEKVERAVLKDALRRLRSAKVKPNPDGQNLTVIFPDHPTILVIPIVLHLRGTEFNSLDYVRSVLVRRLKGLDAHKRFLIDFKTRDIRKDEHLERVDAAKKALSRLEKQVGH